MRLTPTLQQSCPQPRLNIRQLQIGSRQLRTASGQRLQHNVARFEKIHRQSLGPHHPQGEPPTLLSGHNALLNEEEDAQRELNPADVSCRLFQLLLQLARDLHRKKAMF